MAIERYRCRAWILALLLFAPGALAGPGLRGVPLMQRYTSEDYPSAPSHLSVTSDLAGVIYVGNFEGVLRFAGREWERFDLPGSSPARSLVRSHDGRIYVGGYDRFGALGTGDDGTLSYEDLRQAFGLHGEEAHVGDVWAVLETPRGIYFRASRRLFFLARDGATRQWPLAPEVRGFSVVGEALYARVAGIGIARFEDGELVPLPGAEALADTPLVLATAHADGLLLVGENGFHLATAGGIRPLASEADALFAIHPPYAGHVLDDGSMVFGSFDGVLTRFSAERRLLDRVRLGSSTITSFAADREGGLWVTTEGDLIRLKLPSPWTAYTDAQGIVGSLADSAWYDDALWLATSVDVMRAEPRDDGQARFSALGWTNLEAFDLEATHAGLLVAEREGVLVLDPGASAPRRLATADAAYLIQTSRHDKKQAFVLAEREVIWLVERAGRWQTGARWPLQGMNPNTLLEAEPGTLWLGDLRGAPQRWTVDTAQGTVTDRIVFGSARGIRLDPEAGTSLFQLDRTVYAVSGTQGFRLEGEHFVPSDLGALAGLARPMEIALQDTPLGTYAWTSRQLLHRAPEGREFHPLQIDSRLARGFTQAQVDSDGMLRIITWNGLLQFDPGVTEPPLPPLRTSLELIEQRLPDASIRRLPLQPATPPRLAAKSGLAFRFGLVSMEPDAEFRYLMRGHAEQWSEWRGERDLLYRSLPPGHYELEVQARTRSGRSATALHYPFLVAPTWYQTPLAWIASSVLLAFTLAGIAQLIVQLRYRQFVATTRRLERKISERTAELETANRKLAELATEDTLTGVPNRRALEQALAREWQRCGELQQPLAVVMIDVDHFKQFNDRHGHLEGDRQLHWVAQQLALEVQPVRELLARFGGEEFAVVLPGLYPDEAATRAERMRKRFELAGSPLTVSLGVAAMVPTPNTEPQQLLRLADTALYRAKRKGRNRVEAAED